MSDRGTLRSVNVAEFRLLQMRGRAVKTGIFKRPTSGPVMAGPAGLEGDHIADRRYHGGEDKALYAYSVEDYEYWARELDRDWEPGLFGENLTVAGLDPSHSEIGERWRIGSVELEVSQPRLPCAKLGTRFGDLTMVRRFGEASRPGAYFRIVTEGELGAGDEIERLSRPAHGITVALVSDSILLDESLRSRAGSAPELAESLAVYLRQAA